MALGQAFISVNADLRPFAKELNRQVPLILKEAESAVKAEAKKTFGNAGKSGAKSFDRSFKQNLKAEKTFISVTSSLAEALDDGISALPAEVKAAIVLGIVASLPIIAALLTGAVSAALLVGFAGVGVLVAAQFEEVRAAGTSFFTFLRDELVNAGSVFVQPVLDAIDSIRTRFTALEPDIRKLFETAAKFIGPVVDAFASFVEALLPGLQAALENIQPLLPDLIEGAALLGQAIGESLRIITESPGAEDSLQTLLGLVIGLVIGTAALVRIFTDLYHILLVITPLTLVLDSGSEATIRMRDASGELSTAQDYVVAATKRENKALTDQEKAAKAAKKAVEDYIDAQYAFVHSEIDFERALDDLSAAVTKHGRTLDFDKEEGRKAAEAILRGLEAARKSRDDAIASGKLTEAQAQELYNKEIARLRARALELGVVKTKYDELAASVLAVKENPIQNILSPAAKAQIEEARRLLTLYLKAFGFGGPKTSPSGGKGGSNKPQVFATGGIVSAPTLALVGEAGAEAIVPLSRPQRAAQIMSEAGLGGLGDIYVYIGNDQLDSRMFKVARGAQRQQAQRLYAGTRSGF